MYNSEEITITAGRTFNHPYESYSNLRFDITVKAELEEGENHIEAIQAMQHEAETRAEEHKAALLKDIHLLEEQGRVSAKMSDIERRIKQANEELERMKKWQEENAAGSQVLLKHEEQEDEDNADNITFHA